MDDPAGPANPEQLPEPQADTTRMVESPVEPAIEPAIEPALEPAPQPAFPAWSRTYELPTARRVVSAGLQLAASSSATIRRASIYIGLLALGAFGPLAILLLVWIGRLAGDAAFIEAMTTNPGPYLNQHQDLIGVFGLMYLLLIIGLFLLVAISIDAQAIAIALLGGIASERPLRLWEAIIRARQTFWRLVGSGLIVGTVAGLVSIVILIPFMRPHDSNQGLSFVASLIATLIVAPFAYTAAGIVLGDVGAVEALRRSYRLFRARPWTALVVVMFTLVTSTIQTFALSAGVDAASRVADILDLGLDQGPTGLILPSIIVLGVVMAFGSLTFTIAAIVAAPQVAAFLGLTFHAGGIDRARTPGDTKPDGVRWVTVKMLVAIALVAGLALIGLPDATPAGILT